MVQPILLQQALLQSAGNRDPSKMKSESVKKSLEKSKNVLEEKRKMVKQKICIKKTKTFTIIAMNFVQEQLTSRTELKCLLKNFHESHETSKAYGSKKAAQQLALRALPLYPVFEDEKLNGRTKNWSSEKLHKEDYGTILSATKISFESN